MADAPRSRQDGIGPTTRLECKICWTVYDPALGDEVWQIPPGTPFDQIPDDWFCPQCGSERASLVLIED